MKVSIVISFYNKIDFLKFVLAGFERQVFKDFEVIISDDGSNPEVVEQLVEIIKASTFPIQHIWHEDNGWRKNIILNQSVLAARGDYLIFIDGDCIPHKNFVLDHYKNREENTALAGRRVQLSTKISKSLTLQKVSNGWLDKNFFFTILFDNTFGKTKHFNKGINLSIPMIKNKIDRINKSREILGCNFSLHKNTLLKINGFDERFLGPCYGEDIDVDLRLMNEGAKVKLLRYCAVQYHIYHPIISRADMHVNKKIYDDNKNRGVGYTKHGINK